MSSVNRRYGLIVNADDLGMSPGANSAILRCFDAGKITDASIMSNADYFDDAIEGLIRRGIGKIGVHLNLTYGKALNEGSSLQDENGLLNNGFVSLFRKTAVDESLSEEIEEELEAQIRKVEESGLNITHLDSHRHVHMIPAIYSRVVKLAEKHGIPRVRVIDENIFDSLKIGGNYRIFANGGIVKYALLKSLSTFNRREKDLGGGVRFFSILYTGGITKPAIEKIVSGGEGYEIMVHPGDPALDGSVDFYDAGEKAYRTSTQRALELEALLDSPLELKEPK